MYEIKEIVISRSNDKRKQLIIEFQNPQMAIVGAFLMNDALLLQSNAAIEVEHVISGRKSSSSFTGIRCHLQIERVGTVITDLYEDVFDEAFSYSSYKMNTEQLLALINMWKERVKKFRQREK